MKYCKHASALVFGWRHKEETRELILILLGSVAAEAIEVAEQVRTDAEGVDQYVGRPSLGVVAAAVAMLFGSVPVGGLILLGAGIVGIIVGGMGSNVLRKRANRLNAFGERLQALVGDLDDA